MSVKTTDSGEATLPPTSALLATREGETIVLADKATARSAKTKSGGAIYTDELPSLEELLRRYEVVSAVIEKPVPVLRAQGEVVTDQPVVAQEEERGGRVGYPLILALGGIPAATFAAGLVVLVGALIGGGAVSNAYIGLLLFFGGIGLAFTARAAIRDTSQG